MGTVQTHYDENNNPLYATRYAHLKNLPDQSVLKVGQEVTEGQIIGTMGASGGATGPHLHFEIQQYNPQTKAWTFINPGVGSTEKPFVNVGKFNNLNEIPNE